MTNGNPTMCINDLIQQYNIQNNCRLEPLSCALLVAHTVNCMDTLVNRFQQGGPDAVLPTYYKRWLHRSAGRALMESDRRFNSVGVLMHIHEIYINISYTYTWFHTDIYLYSYIQLNFQTVIVWGFSWDSSACQLMMADIQSGSGLWHYCLT